MAKPTLIQSILGRPSQAYHFPQTKEYYSTKHEFVRAAAEAASESRPQSYLTAPDRESGYYSSTSTASASVYSEARSSSPLRWSRETTPDHRPDSLVPLSPSSASSHSNTDDRSDRPLTRPSTYSPPTSFASDTTPRQSPLSSLNRTSDRKSSRSISGTALHGDDDDDTEGSPVSGETTTETEDDSDEVFYTPTSSLVGSPRTSCTSTGMLIDPKALTRALLPLPLSRSKSSLKSEASLRDPTSQAADAQPVSRTSSESSLESTSSASSSSAEGTVASSTYTSSRTTTTTPLTTPATSDHGSTRQATFRTVTIARSPTRSQTAPTVMGPAVSGLVQPRPLSATRRRSHTEIQRNLMDEDWAKDVRWLAPIIAAKDPPRRSDRVVPTEYLPADHSRSFPRIPPQPAKSYPPPSPSSEHRKRSRRSRGSRSSRGRMSALLEEDESEYSDITPGGSSTEPSRAPSPVQEEPPQPSSSPSPLGASVTRSQSHRSGKETSASSGEDAAENPDARLKAYAQQTRKSYSHTRRLSRSISPTSFSYTNTLPTHAIPTPHVESITPAANGYTALTLPRAAYNGDAKVSSGDGKIDLVRSGIAQSSMATVEVTKGGALQPEGAAKKKRRTFSTFSLQLPFKILDKRNSKGKGKESQTPAHLLDTLPLPVAFTSHIPPPSYVPSSHVVVQVFAVGLDALDSLLVQEKTVNGAKGAGFIPGRSVVGKAIEVGWDVKNDVCKRGDWVIALLDVKKSGALAEFVTVERHRVHRAPQPLSRPTSFFPSNRRSHHVRSRSLPSQFNRHPYAQLHQDLISPMRMTIEELALLPLSALPAHRAVRTFADVISPAKPKPNATEELRVRALVLQGHDGPGAIAVQLLARRGVKVWVQVPDSWARDDTNEGDDEDTDSGSKNGSPSKGKGTQTRFDRLEARLRAWGAEAICVGEPLEVLERLAEDGRSFDAILDTVGGVAIWETARRVLLNDPEQDTTLQQGLDVSPTTATPPVGLPTRASSSANKRSFALTQFTTLVGDTPTRPVPSAHDHLRSGFRSLKRTMSTGTRSRSSSPTKSSAASVLTSSPSKDSLGSVLRRSTSTKSKTKKRTVSYAWVSVAADVDFEGEDIRDSLGAIVSMVEEGAIRPWVGDESEDGNGRVVPFDKAPEVFRRDGEGSVGVLRDGGTCIVKVIP